PANLSAGAINPVAVRRTRLGPVKFFFISRVAWAAALSLAPALCLAQGEGLDGARQYPLQSGTLAGRPIQFYDFGPSSPSPQDAYRLPDGSLVFSSAPESPLYSGVRIVYDLRGLDPTAPEKFPHSQAEVLALVRSRTARLAWTGTTLNLPLVPAGSTLERDPEGRA